MKVKKVNWYGLNHKKVCKLFKKDLTYCNDFCVNGEYEPVSVFHDPNPDKAKGHKSYLLLKVSKPNLVVMGMDAEEIEKFRYQAALHCKECDTVIYSANRHHYNSCECPNETSIDGGKDYMRCSAKDLNKYEHVTLDLLTDNVTVNKVS